MSSLQKKVSEKVKENQNSGMRLPCTCAGLPMGHYVGDGGCLRVEVLPRDAPKLVGGRIYLLNGLNVDMTYLKDYKGYIEHTPGRWSKPSKKKGV